MTSAVQPQRFYSDPYFIVNYLVFLSFIPVRLFLFPSSQDASSSSFFTNREFQFYVAFILLIAAKWRQSYNTSMFLTSIMTHCRGIILLVSFLYYPRAMVWYIIPFIVFTFTLKRDTYKPVSRVSKITDYTFESEILDDFTTTKHLLFFHHPDHQLCQFVFEDYIDLSVKHGNPRLKFHMIDVTKSPQTMVRYNIRGNDPFPVIPSLTIPSKQLPTVLCFTEGRIQEEGQLPLLLPDNKVRPLTWANMLKYFELSDHLRQPKSDADQPNAEAQSDVKGKKPTNTKSKKKSAKID